MIVEIGAGISIPSIRRYTEGLANQLQTKYYRVNPRDFQVGENGESLQLGALEGIKEVLKNK